MRSSHILGAWLFLLTSTMRPAAAQQLPIGEDRAYRLIGSWSCETATHTTGTMTFSRAADGSMSMTNLFTNSSGFSAEFDEKYAFDPRSERWIWTFALHPSTTEQVEESAVAAPWTEETWTFEGTTKVTLLPRPGSVAAARIDSQYLRMVYTARGDATFGRAFKRYRNGDWVTISASRCKRVGA